MSKNEVVQAETISASVENTTQQLITYLQNLGLPHQGILVDPGERKKVIKNLPDALDTIPLHLKNNSIYISKFVAASAAGLFDAALNFLWDETIVCLRDKVIRFDLSYFLDSTITDEKRRSKFKTDEDILNIEDWELIKGCNLIGILSDIGYKHLDYIRDMRNWASAAHPNQNELTGLQLVSWLETCIKEVIAKEPDQSAIQSKQLIENIRNQTLTTADIGIIISNIQKLKNDRITSLLRTIFGMYTSTNNQIVKTNISYVAKSVWQHSESTIKYEIGIKYQSFAANGDVTRKAEAKNFLTLVDGLSFLPEDSLAVEINEQLTALYSAHNNFNNFYNEPPLAKNLRRYINLEKRVPKSVENFYVKVITMCKITNGNGRAWNADSIYDEFIATFSDSEIGIFTTLLFDTDMISRLQFSTCQDEFLKLTKILNAKAINLHLKQILTYIEQTSKINLSKLHNETAFREFFQWNK